MRSLEEAISEVERELNVRLRCYDRWTKEGKLSGVDAKDRLERMSAALHYLKQQASTPDKGQQSLTE